MTDMTMRDLFALIGEKEVQRVALSRRCEELEASNLALQEIVNGERAAQANPVSDTASKRT